MKLPGGPNNPQGHLNSADDGQQDNHAITLLIPKGKRIKKAAMKVSFKLPSARKE